MNPDYIFILIIAVASISFKPGPGMAAIVARAIENGFWSAFAVSMGAITIELAYFTLAYFSFSYIENQIDNFSIILKIVGSSYLFYLAYSTFKKSKILPNQNIAQEAPQQNFFKDYMIGIFVTLANPLVILFYTALIPTILDLSSVNVTGLITALITIFMVHFVILTSQCVLATQVKIFLQDKVTIQKFNLASALLLLIVGLYILFSLRIYIYN
jgi:threonine/homoserine/homoserine lactone efflux protein